MANQPQQLTQPPLRTFTRSDFSALRARVQGVPLATIARLYYDADTAPHAVTVERLEQYLREMRDELVRLAILQGSSVLADHLRTSIRKHGSAKLTGVTLRMVEQAARLAVATPQAGHGVGLWFRPLIAKRLAGEGITTLGELITYCNRHGGTWWRAVPRIGALRASTLVAWLRRHEASIGVTLEADVDTRELVPVAGDPADPHNTVIVIGGSPERPHLAPFERMALPAQLSGGEPGMRGVNRAGSFAFIRAPHDLAALHAWLHRYRDRPETLRAYTREIERFVMWAVIVRGVAVSSATVEDCEAYKDFVARPAEAFTGPRRPRSSGRWKPFTGELSVDSQAYAVRTLRAAFAWLVDVRYLAGNPWHAIQDPAAVTRETPIAVHRALPAKLWAELRAEVERLAGGSDAEARQWRIVRVAFLLMGDSGLRRAEVVSARRETMRLEVDDGAGAQASLWMLSITGKGRRARTVPVSPETLEALRAHWVDRERDFAAPGAAGPLIAPLMTLATTAALSKHGRHDGDPSDPPYSVNALGNLVRRAVQRLVSRLAAREDVSVDELKQLASVSAHAFRHTFGTQSIAQAMPADVVQAILGHASLQTTSIYVRSERLRIRAEAARYYAGIGVKKSGRAAR